MKKAIKLNQKQLRGIINEELKRVTEAGGDYAFEINDMSLHIEQDDELFEVVGELAMALAHHVVQLALKEDLVNPEDEDELSDSLMADADSKVRDMVGGFIKSALASIQTQAGH